MFMHTLRYTGSMLALAFLFGVAPAWAQTPVETEVAKLLAGDAVAGDHFGYSVAVDGDTAVIGTLNGDGNVSNSGAAYVFTRDGADGAWSQQVKLLASDGGATDQVGLSVPWGGDTAVIGAQLDDDNGSNSGATYVFTRDGADSAGERRVGHLCSARGTADH